MGENVAVQATSEQPKSVMRCQAITCYEGESENVSNVSYVSGCCEDSRSSLFSELNDGDGGEDELHKKMAGVTRLWCHTLWRAI
jgi:hypothetical protein